MSCPKKSLFSPEGSLFSNQTHRGTGRPVRCGELKKGIIRPRPGYEKGRSENLPFSYPEPGSNRHGLPHWCLRPARLPIPPSGHCNAAGFFTKAGAKVLYFSETAKVSDKKMKNTCLYQLFFLTSPTETKAIDIIDGKNRQEKFLCYPRRGPRQTLVAM